MLDNSNSLAVEWERVGAPLSPCGLSLKSWSSGALGKCWSATNTCTAAKYFWSAVNRAKSSELIALSKVHLSLVVGILIGHGPKGKKFIRYNGLERRRDRIISTLLF